MAWQQRLREAAYTSPSGARLAFDYEATQEEFAQKGGPFEFADANGTYVQPMGATGRRYPLRLVLWGADCDLLAAAWMDALGETGPGILEHPMYGRVDVVPVGTVKRRDDMVRAGNQAIIEVEFFATVGLVYPSSKQSAQALTLDEANAAQAEQLVDLDSTTDPDFLARYNTALDVAADALRGITPDPNTFNAIESSINRGINVLIRDPLTLAFQTQILIQQPSRFLKGLANRLDAYGNLFNSIIGNDAQTTTELSVGDLFASATATAAAQAATRTDYQSRPQAVAAAENVLQTMDALANYRDQSFGNASEVDPGRSWQATQDALALAAGILVDQSFALAQERTTVITSPRSIIDLAYELYGEVDAKLDELINTNDLSGDEIIELPRGREIVYYAA